MTINAFGQSLCIDDVVIYDQLTSNSSPILMDSDFSVLPNPSQGSASLQIKLHQPVTFSASIYDVQGKQVYEFPTQNLPIGTHTLPFTLNAPTGVYLIKAIMNGQTITRKLIKN